MYQYLNSALRRRNQSLKFLHSRLYFQDDGTIPVHPLALDASNHIGTITGQPYYLQTKSLARASPSWQAIASTTFASVFPSTTSDEAPKKLPSSSRAIVADVECLELLETIASTLIMASPAGGLIHRRRPCPLSCL